VSSLKRLRRQCSRPRRRTETLPILYNYCNVHTDGQTPRSLTSFPSHTIPSPLAVPVHTLQLPNYTFSVPYSSLLFVAGAWLCYFCTHFLQQCESQNVCLQPEISYFYDLKSPTQLAYRTKFCGVPDGLFEPCRIGTKGIPGLKRRLYRMEVSVFDS